MEDLESKFKEVGLKKDKAPAVHGKQNKNIGGFKKDLNYKKLPKNELKTTGEPLAPEDRDLYDKYRYSAVNPMEDVLRHIQEEKGQEISEQESLRIQEFIYRSVFFTEGKPGIPSKTDENYHLFEINYHSEKMAEEVVKMNEIFADKKSEKIPDFVYVQTDDDSKNPTLIIKYSYANFISSILPYIQKNALGNYIVTDGRSTTITFLGNGIVYWSRLDRRQESSSLRED